jgi:hypothetical protein
VFLIVRGKNYLEKLIPSKNTARNNCIHNPATIERILGASIVLHFCGDL